MKSKRVLPLLVSMLFLLCSCSTDNFFDKFSSKSSEEETSGRENMPQFLT